MLPGYFVDRFSTDDDLALEFAPDPDGLTSTLLTFLPKKPSIGGIPVEIITQDLADLAAFQNHGMNGENAADVTAFEIFGLSGAFEYHCHPELRGAVAALKVEELVDKSIVKFMGGRGGLGGGAHDDGACG